MKPIAFFITFSLIAQVASGQVAATSDTTFAPVSATASSQQGNRSPDGIINGMGLVETPPGSDVWAHEASSDSASRGAMWTGGFPGGKGDVKATLTFDLGETLGIGSLRVWNYNEQGQTKRGLRDVDILASDDGENWRPVVSVTLAEGTGESDYAGQLVPLPGVEAARYFRLQTKSHHGGDTTGFSEIRFNTFGEGEEVGTIDEAEMDVVAPEALEGFLISPVGVTASSAQGTASAEHVIDLSGMRKLANGVWVHSKTIYGPQGKTMWNASNIDGKADYGAVLTFDLGKVYPVNGLHVWNYNDAGSYLNRGIKEFEILVSEDGEDFLSLGEYVLEEGTADKFYAGEVVPFDEERARFARIVVKSTFRGSEFPGLAEIQFNVPGEAGAELKAESEKPFVSKYPRPTYRKAALGTPLEGGEDFSLPEDYGHVDVTKPPYGAKGDGVTDDTAALQKALDDNRGSIIYLPNGIYKVSDTLKWPGSNPTGGSDFKNTALQGQSRDGTIIQLADGAPGFGDPQAIKPVIWTGPPPAQRFFNELFHLTVDTGADNRGAVGVHFMASNSGGIYNVAITSGDGQSVAGLDFAYADENGPLLVRGLRVTGFDYGIRTAHGVNSQTLENIEVQHQNRAGIHVAGQVFNVRNLTSRNEVPALVVVSGVVSLDGATLVGEGDAADVSAIENSAALLARNVQTTGYERAIGGKDAPGGGNVAWFQTPAPTPPLVGPAAPPLPVEETPEIPREDPSTWVSVDRFKTDGNSDAEAIQAAIDSGATTIYLPKRKFIIDRTIVIRGKVRRILGAKTWLDMAPKFKTADQPVFRFEDGEAPVVFIERMTTDFTRGKIRFLETKTARTLVLRQVAINFHAARSGVGYRGEGGKLFLEDVVGPGWEFKNQTVFARQFNSEVIGTHIRNDGGKVWIFGLKTERPGTIVETLGGGQSEVFGGLIYNIGNKEKAPMFTVTNASLNAFVAEAHFSNTPYQTFVKETRGGRTEERGIAGPFKGQRVISYGGTP